MLHFNQRDWLRMFADGDVPPFEEGGIEVSPGTDDGGLPIPKTRKEYFMAIAAGGVPGTDFPERLESPDIITTVENTYVETLEHAGTTTYKYAADINNFVKPTVLAYERLVVKLNTKQASFVGSDRDPRWAFTDGAGNLHELYYDGRDSNWKVSITTDNVELPPSALIDYEVYIAWDKAVPGTPLQPKTVEEAYYANLAHIEVAESFTPKTRKDQYLNALSKKKF